jgi:flagellin
MAFSIQTNVNALIAQENLRVNSDFQNRTIQRLTSGFRINQSGDDAAGLAVANKFRSDTAELNQGVRNANDGVSQLQIMDGGMNNISKMLDRLKTLATQSASQTFTGNRTVLNNEYQTLVGEIDRQAQSIGLATGGRFAQSISVYIGGGVTNSGAMDTANGAVSVNLSSSIVDTRALGLSGQSFTATGAAGSDIGVSSLTSITNILANANNGQTATFAFNGSGYTGITVSVDLTGVTGAAGLASKLNDAIEATGNSAQTGAARFLAANIQAAVVTDASGMQQLSFSSTAGAFEASATSKTANALMGNFKVGAGAEGADVVPTYTAGTIIAAGAGSATAKLKFIIDGVATAWSANVDLSGNAAAKLLAVQGALTGLGITSVTASSSSGYLKFTGTAGHTFEVEAAGDLTNALGLGNWTAEAASIVGSAATVAANGQVTTLGFSINGGSKVLVAVNNDTSGNIVNALTAAFAANKTLAAATMGVSFGGGAFTFTTGAGAAVRISVESRTGGATMDLGLAFPANAPVSASSVLGATGPTEAVAVGTSQTGVGASQDVFSFAGLRNVGDAQSLAFNTTAADGSVKTTSVSLTTANAGSLDAAVSAINTALQAQSSTELKNIVAVKQLNGAGTAEGIRFISSQQSFSVTVGGVANSTDTNPVGVYDGTAASAAASQGKAYDSSQAVNTTAGDIITVAAAKAVVVALGQAVQKLGAAQAAVGKGQNQLGYAVNLAQSQISNFSAAESRIRDADIAAEAANLTKAQVLQQASMAAMAQANSAPQAVLTLLRG